jgi:hypothetical protein
MAVLPVLAGDAATLDDDLLTHMPTMVDAFLIRWGRNHCCNEPGMIM